MLPNGNNGKDLEAEASSEDEANGADLEPTFVYDGRSVSQTLEALDKMRTQRHFCDVVLRGRDGDFEIYAHRCVLAAASPYLFGLLAERPTSKEVDNGVVYELDGVGFERRALEVLVDFAYTAR